MIGDRIKELRKKNRYTQKEIGEMCGVSDISVYKWETDRTEPNIDTLCKLADIFGVSLDYLLGRTTELERNLDADSLRDRMHKILNNPVEEHKNLRIWKGRSRDKK